MAQYTFDAPRTCPACHAEFLAAEQQKEFHPVIVVRCPQCGRAHITKEQSAFYAGRNGVPASYFETCDACKRKQMARTFENLAVAR